MIDFNSESIEKNAKTLLKGMWYSELPDLLNMSRLCENILDIIKNQQDYSGYEAYEKDQDGFIEDYKKIVSPSYLRKPGVEPITYYAFKKNKSFREMQIPNLLHYIAFIYNSLWCFEDIFEKLYCSPQNEIIIGNSNSYVVLGEEFFVEVDYEEFEEQELGVFTDKNNKIQGNAVMSANKLRYDSMANAYIYGMKVDIESFFPNVYTHYLEKISGMEPYASLANEVRYFEFLDKFHQRINNNQTKGLPAGTFSAHIAAELLMLCVDFLIRQELAKEDVGYIRYVDDLTFFSDSQEKLDKIQVKVQKILNIFRLRINGNKTAIFRNAINTQLTNIDEIYRMLDFLIEDRVSVLIENNEFQYVKNYIINLVERNQMSQIKAVLSLLLNDIEEGRRVSSDIVLPFFCFLQTLVFEDENLTWHIYRVMDMLMNLDRREECLEVLKKKLEIIDTEYSDTLLQIWHYYILTKNMSEEQRQEFFDEKKDDLSNPIIITMFIEEGEHKNAKVVAKIKELFKQDEKGTDWKSKIIYSKWWLPICKIKMVDSHNYENLFAEDKFPKVLSDILA